MGVVVVAHRCVACDLVVEPHAARHVRAGETEMLACPSCDRALVAERSRVVVPITELLVDTLRWPFRKDVLPIVAGVALVTALVGLLDGRASVIATSLRFVYLFAVLRAAALGRDEAEIDPGRMGGDAFEWFGLPTLRVAATVLVAALPAVVAHLALGSPLVTGLVAVAGAFYLPAALVVTAHGSRLDDAVSPLLALRFVRAIPRDYAVTCAFLAVLTGAGVLAAGVASRVAGDFGSSLVAFVPMVIAARALGVLVEAHEEKIVA